MPELALHKRALPKYLRGEVPSEVAEALAELPAWFERWGQLDFDEHADLDVRPLKGHDVFWRLRVGRWRAIFQRIGDVFLVLAVELRKDVYRGELPTSVDEADIDGDSLFEDRRWERLRVVRRREGLQVVEARAPDGPGSTTDREVVSRSGPRVVAGSAQNPLAAFTDDELSRVDGVDAGTLAWLRTLPASIDLGGALGGRLGDADALAVLVELWERPGDWVDAFAEGGVPTVADMAVPDDELARRLRSDESRTQVVTATTAGQIRKLLDASIEDWMVYLHPSQRSIAQAGFNGPGRVSGGPGTGKTVVALHRARWLARESNADGFDANEGRRPVLLTTFLRTLPPVWNNLMGLLDAGASEHIAFLGVDQVARQVVQAKEAVLPIIDNAAREKLAKTLVQRCGLPAVFEERPGMLLEEFDAFITGRGTTDPEEYYALRRRGGGIPLVRADRERVWAAYEEYCTSLRRKRRTDFHLVRAAALRIAAEGFGPRFDGVIVDEAQDLTEVGVRLLHALDSSPDHRGFLIVGDGQQSIYPGGFSLGSLGIDVRGRSRVLTQNWRNTWSVWNAASAVIHGEAFDDLDEDAGLRPTDDEPEPLSVGSDAELHLLRSPAEELELLAALVAERIAAGTDAGDIAVLCSVKRKAKDVMTALRAADVPSEDLESYDGMHADGVLVGTHRRAKGLEFKEVFVAGLGAAEWPSRWAVPPELDPEQRTERMGLELRQLFVAMTRARDRLVLTSGGPVAPEIAAAQWAMDVREY